MATPIYDVVIVGGGAMGAAAAWRASARGARVLLLERDDALVHEHGSSHGESRIVRRL
jgi:glycine/D-amino acid oxidase-like deaminating enzyme